MHSATTLLLVSLLALLAPVYVLAMQLLRRVLRQSEKLEAEATKQQKGEWQKWLADLEDRLSQAEREGDLGDILRSFRAQAKSAPKELRRQLRRIRLQWKRLSTWRIVGLPGSLFLTALMLNLSARFVACIGIPRCPPWMTVGFTMWVGAVALLLLGICQLYRGLAYLEAVCKGKWGGKPSGGAS